MSVTLHAAAGACKIEIGGLNPSPILPSRRLSAALSRFFALAAIFWPCHVTIA
jgi:hypothetical protein